MRKTIWIWVLLCVVVLAMIAYWVPPFFAPWTEWNCWHQEVDISTGRLRFSRYFFFYKLSEYVRDSAVSQALPKDLLQNAKPNWHFVNTFSPGPGSNYSPHYIFHSAIAQIYEFTKMVDRRWVKVPEDVKQKIAMHIVALWQHYGTDCLAGYYLDGLGTELLDCEFSRAASKVIFDKLRSITMPEITTKGGVTRYTVFYHDGQPWDMFEGYVDATGGIVRHGIAICWYKNGKKKLYASFKHGMLDGLRFQWEKDGTISCIEKFHNNELVDYARKNISDHPAYKIAKELYATDKE